MRLPLPPIERAAFGPVCSASDTREDTVTSGSLAKLTSRSEGGSKAGSNLGIVRETSKREVRVSQRHTVGQTEKDILTGKKEHRERGCGEKNASVSLRSSVSPRLPTIGILLVMLSVDNESHGNEVCIYNLLICQVTVTSF